VTGVTEVDASVIRVQAMDSLARREYSRYELEQRLTIKFPGYRGLIHESLDNLEQDGLLSDARFAEAFTRSRIRKGQGPRRIRSELLERRVQEEVIERSLRNSGFDWPTLAAEALVKKFGVSPAADYREKTRRMRFLQQRGFAIEQIRLVMDND